MTGILPIRRKTQEVNSMTFSQVLLAHLFNGIHINGISLLFYSGPPLHETNILMSEKKSTEEYSILNEMELRLDLNA